jgi:hypothetical protein
MMKKIYAIAAGNVCEKEGMAGNPLSGLPQARLRDK